MKEKRVDLINQIRLKLDSIFVSRFRYYCPALSLGSDKYAPPISYYKSLLSVVDCYLSHGFDSRMFSDSVLHITSTGFYDGALLVVPCTLEYINGTVINFFTSHPSAQIASVDWNVIKCISFTPIL